MAFEDLTPLEQELTLIEMTARIAAATDESVRTALAGVMIILEHGLPEGKTDQDLVNFTLHKLEYNKE